jgi:hypothetical protein
LLVATITGLSYAVSPTAQQWLLVAHDTPVRFAMPLGDASAFHVPPPFVVVRTAPASRDVVCPTTKQSALVGHDTPSRSAIPLGIT